MTAPIPTETAVPGAPNAARDRDRAGGDPAQRAVPYFCPFCAGEDLRPASDRHGEWACRTCARAFAVRFIGLVVGS